MKKILALVVCAALALNLSGCCMVAIPNMLLEKKKPSQMVTAPTWQTEPGEMPTMMPESIYTEPYEEPTTEPVPETIPYINDHEPYDALIEFLLSGQLTMDNAWEHGVSHLHAYLEDPTQITYALVDIDGDGQDELLLSEDNGWCDYDMLTVQNGQLVNLFSSAERSCFRLLTDGYAVCTGSSGAAYSSIAYYHYEDGQLRLLADLYTDPYTAYEMGLIDDLDDFDWDAATFITTGDDLDNSRQVTQEELAYWNAFDSRYGEAEIDYQSIAFYP